MPASLKAPDPDTPLKTLRDVFAYNVRLYRVTKSLSQEALGHDANLDRTFISQVERGKVNASLENIGRIADALGISAAKLLEWPKERPRS